MQSLGAYFGSKEATTIARSATHKNNSTFVSCPIRRYEAMLTYMLYHAFSRTCCYSPRIPNLSTVLAFWMSLAFLFKPKSPAFLVSSSLSYLLRNSGACPRRSHPAARGHLSSTISFLDRLATVIIMTYFPHMSGEQGDLGPSPQLIYRHQRRIWVVMAALRGVVTRPTSGK